VEFFKSWPADADRPDDRLFGGQLEDLEPAAIEYSPDDSVPWAWDLEAELFARDFNWDALLEMLKRQGPAE
jgi:hypothetical protein